MKNLKEIKKLFVEKVGERNKFNFFRFDSKIKGGKKIIVKSYGSYKYKEIWEEILKEINKDGWELFEGSSWRGDGSVYGIIKYIKE